MESALKLILVGQISHKY